MSTEPPTASTATTYCGNCHCGALQYTVLLPRPLDSKPSQIMSCNCSICTKNGYLLVYPSIKDVTFTTGKLEDTVGYEFGEKTVTHRFCPKCGSSVFVDDLRRTDVLCVNIRHFKNVDVKILEFQHYDGFAKMNPPYEFA